MNSLKNTIVAVGLLGLSFVFYQLSDPKNQPDPNDSAATELDAMISEDTPSVQMPNLDSSVDSEPSKPAFDVAPPVAKTSPPPQPLPAPKSSSPFAGQPKLASNGSPSANDDSSSFKPRPQAKFGFDKKPSATFARPDKKVDVAGPNTMSQQTPQEKRDQGLMAALDRQKQASDSNSFAAAPAKAKAKAKAKVQAKQVSAVRDPAVVGASSVDGDKTSARDFGMQPVEQDPHANLSFRDAWPVVEKMVSENNFRGPLKILTRFYNDSDLSGPQRQRLVEWLDALALKVVYSSEHHLHPPYFSKPGDNMLTLRQSWGVPGQLILDINRENITDANALAVGTELKKLTGPAHANLDLKTGTITVFIEGLYAGRFHSKVGVAGSPRPGRFEVQFKNEAGHEWRDDSGGVFAPGTPQNQYGRYWIGLNGQLCIHAIDPAKQAGHPGCFGLSEKDARELFAILSEGSTVTIK